MPLQYHAAQIEVQEEANTRPVAEMLANWAGPVQEFASVADLIVLATADLDGRLHFATACGQAPLVEAVGPTALRLLGPVAPFEAAEALVGGLAINLGQRRRVRLNGRLRREGGTCLLEAQEAFVNCRKYIAPSVAVDVEPHVGPIDSSHVGLDDPWLAGVLSKAETAFLASVAPDGQPDVSHRGGPPGFLRLDVEQKRLTWPEFVGDGMLKSAGNVRATSQATLLVLDLQTGDAVELAGDATYRTLRTAREARSDALEQHRDPFPIQGQIDLSIKEARRLTGMIHARRRIAKAEKMTSCSPIDDQYPQ
jgi:predicted pyridoxine 5'-phosphate oxidase superfamily flavin-nucleotide-binding protein